ncbi:hypothetical protein EMCRGX_G003785 [Ephydatia muelleri]
MDTVADVDLGFGPGVVVLSKVDVRSAYRTVPVHPEDKWLLGMQWNGQLFMDTVLPFGLRSAPKHFTAVADAVEWESSFLNVEHETFNEIFALLIQGVIDAIKKQMDDYLGENTGYTISFTCQSPPRSIISIQADESCGCSLEFSSRNISKPDNNFNFKGNGRFEFSMFSVTFNYNIYGSAYGVERYHNDTEDKLDEDEMPWLIAVALATMAYTTMMEIMIRTVMKVKIMAVIATVAVMVVVKVKVVIVMLVKTAMMVMVKTVRLVVMMTVRMVVMMTVRMVVVCLLEQHVGNVIPVSCSMSTLLEDGAAMTAA